MKTPNRLRGGHWICVTLLLHACLTQLIGAGDPAASRKKFIELGWDIPSTRLLRESWREMEQTTPFDGVMFKVEIQDAQGRKLSSEAVWDARPWQRDWLQEALADVKECHFARFTDNFVRFNATPGNLDWADNAGWAALAEKAGASDAPDTILASAGYGLLPAFIDGMLDAAPPGRCVRGTAPPYGSSCPQQASCQTSRRTCRPS